MLSKTQRNEKLLRHYRKCFPILVFPLKLVNPMILFFTYESTETLSKKGKIEEKPAITGFTKFR